MAFSSLLSKWYLQNKRELPWRENTSPYTTWISEVILQQTRVNQGLPYFYKFLETFPNIVELAQAKEDEILKIWQGLGYYSRARNMHKTAQQIVAEYDGIFPKTYNELIHLKGIGPYTAAAISSICNEEKVAVVDGNVYRVLARFFNIDTPIDSSEGKKYFNQLANELLVEENIAPSIHNQALMELGALVCTPKNALCEECPLRTNCLGKALNTYCNLPQKAKKTAVRNRYFNYLIVIDSNKKMFLKKRNEKDIWQGLYEFPLIESENEVVSNDVIIDTFNKKHQVNTVEKIRIKKYSQILKHKLSHQQLFASFYTLEVKEIYDLNVLNYEVINISDISNYPVPQLIQNYLNFEFENLLSL